MTLETYHLFNRCFFFGGGGGALSELEKSKLSAPKYIAADAASAGWATGDSDDGRRT